MAPELGKDPLPEGQGQKFIRIGEKIVFDSATMGVGHHVIAQENGLIDELPKKGKPLVDDGGFLTKMPWGVVEVEGQTTRCEIVGDKRTARKKSVELIGSLTGEKVTG